MTGFVVVFTLIALLGCGGCSGPKQEEVSFSTVEDARAQAKANATQNAVAYRQSTGQAECQIYARGDSTITNECPNGDGWASMDLICPDGTKKIKCSTVSLALNCLEENDFKGKPYAQDEGHCQPLNKVPHPLPKLTQ